MEVLQVLSNSILPVFAIMAVGLMMGRGGRVSVDDARTINRFAMSVLLPLLVLDLVASAEIYAFTVLPLLIYGGSQVIVFAVGNVLARKAFGCGRPKAMLLAFAEFLRTTYCMSYRFQS